MLKLILFVSFLYCATTSGFYPPAHHRHLFGHHCYWNNPCQTKWYGAKTVYDDARDDIRDIREIRGKIFV